MRAASKDDELPPALPPVRVKVLGDGPDREKLEALAVQLNAPVDFLGYTAYELMAAYLRASDITVNSLVKSAAQSIVTKSATTWPSGNPMINTGSEPRVPREGDRRRFGVNAKRKTRRRWPTHREARRSRVAAQDHGLEGACRRRKGVPTNPARTARSWICCARCL